jgi:transposase
MRQEHKGGEKLFVDFSGDGLWLWDVQSGERTAVRVFVAAMGASSLVYAEAFADEKAESWLSGMTHALEYLGGVPQMVVPDNPRALVVRPDRHEAELTGSVKDWARHHGTTVMPARPYRPKDKAKVEVAVQVAQRWIMAVLRNERFESLATMNAAIGVLVERVNAREMRHIGRSRRSLFEELDRPALRSLPVNRYEYALWSTAVVHPDYHVQVDGQLYSVPHELRGERVNVRLTRGAVEVLKDGACVATHARASGHMRHHTQPGHMPPAHAAVMQQRSVDDVLRQACAAGAHVHVLAQRLMERRTHPEQALRGILGILSLQKTYGAERVDAACARALHFSLLKASAVKDILARSLDMVPHDPPSEENRTLTPVNFRGPQYFLH